MSDEIDLEALDAYLSSDDSPDHCMMLSDMKFCPSLPIYLFGEYYYG
jgi:hypothetical protein